MLVTISCEHVWWWKPEGNGALATAWQWSITGRDKAVEAEEEEKGTTASMEGTTTGASVSVRNAAALCLM